MKHIHQQIRPTWLSYLNASKYSGLSVSALQEHVKSGAIVTSNIRKPGAKRGRRLLCRRSIDQFIEDQIVTPSTSNSLQEGGAA